MTTDLKQKISEPIHQRDITIRTYKTADQQIVVEGTLLDNRLIDTYHLSGDKRPKDAVHHMIVRILVDKKLVIRQVETEMPRTPHEDCPQTINSLRELVGFKITRGFTMKVKGLFGKGRGCSHLTELIISMAPAAIQGYYTSLTSNPPPENLKDTMRLVLADTCWVWRSNGSALKRLGK